jgi:hypothetical protein
MASGRASYEGKKPTRRFPAKGGGSLLANPSSGWMRHLVFIAADCTAAARKADIVKTLRRWVRILCFKVGMIPALIACTAAGTVLRFIS